jgi:predicted nucleotide-binding protein
MSGRITEQEFAAHLYAPLDGPHAEAALRQVRGLWANLQSQLGMGVPIVDAGLDGRLPDDPASEPDGALAGLQDLAVNFQAIARREHDVLNVSLVMATPVNPPRRRRFGLDAVAPPGWYEFERWWRGATSDGIDSLLGWATVFFGKARTPLNAAVRDTLPAEDGDATGWWTRPAEMDGLAVWEVTPGGTEAGRRLVVLSRPDEDARLSTFTWSDGQVALPPLGRYLMHAAKIRYHARVVGDGRQLSDLRRRSTAQLQRTTGGAGDAGEGEPYDDEELADALEALRQMRRSVEIARDNMTRAVDRPLPSDVRFAGWLEQVLADDFEHLDATWEHVRRVRGLRDSGTTTAGVPQPRASTRGPAPVADEGRVEQRIAFGVDVVDYSGRTTPAQRAVQSRLAGVVVRVLSGIGLAMRDTDRQDGGDGSMVVLPSGLEAHRVLPRLLHGWRAEMVADNARHPADRIRVRLAVGSGPFTAAALGFSGSAIIEVGRLLDSDAIRDAAVDHPGCDVVAIVADRLYQDVVGEGYESLDKDQFQRVPVVVKSYRRDAWLWFGVGSVARPPRRPTADRDVFVIHGRDRQAAETVTGLIRALDLHPMDWDEIVARTGRTTPFLRDVLDQAFTDNRAAIVLLTPDDCATPHPSLPDGGGPSVQSSPGVLFQAGMAMARQPERTILVQVGEARPLADLGGLDIVRITADPATHVIAAAKIAQRLRTAGCAVKSSGTDWLDGKRFAGLAAFDRGC